MSGWLLVAAVAVAAVALFAAIAAEAADHLAAGRRRRRQP